MLLVTFIIMGFQAKAQSIDNRYFNAFLNQRLDGVLSKIDDAAVAGEVIA